MGVPGDGIARLDDQFATLHGLYWLTSNLAGRSPLLLVVDDCHWSDGPSLRFLAYLGARLDGLPALVLLAARTGEPAADPELLAEVVALAGEPTIRPGTLGTEAATRLVRAEVGPSATDAFCRACHTASGGNPLLLRTLAASVAAEGLPADDATAGRVAALAAGSVARMLDRQLSRLAADARPVTAVLAILGPVKTAPATRSSRRMLNPADRPRSMARHRCRPYLAAAIRPGPDQCGQTCSIGRTGLWPSTDVPGHPPSVGMARTPCCASGQLCPFLYRRSSQLTINSPSTSGRRRQQRMAAHRDAAPSSGGAGPLAGLVRALRERALLSQEELAQRSGLSVGTVRGLESGRIRRPRSGSVRLLADALRLTEQDRKMLVMAVQGEQVEVGANRSAHAGVVPAQLPAAVAGFTGRADQLKALDAMLAADRETALTPVVISAIAGTAGVGKTALAVHWAHQVAGRFPDGQLYADLRGFDPGGPSVQPADVIRGFLDALGIPTARIPRDLPEQVNLYRSVLAGRRVLVLLDNARDAAQVRLLLPGGPGCLVVVTSRNQLGSLVAVEGAHPVVLDLLTPGEARDLLARRLGAARIAAEPEAVDQIIGRTARLPLALAIVAARAATNPALSLADIASKLGETDASLDALTTGETITDIRTVFSWSYRSLTASAARLFRLLGLHPGPDIGAPAAASSAGLPPADAEPLLMELAQAHLLTEHVRGRYAFHDLLRAYAAELAHTIDSNTDRRAAAHRMFRHYLHTAHATVQVFNPLWRPFEVSAPPAGVTPEHHTTHAQALTWFTVEHPVVLAVIDRAAGTGFDTEAWQLARACSSFLNRRGHWHDWVTTQQTALQAARRAADRLGQAHVHRDLALAHLRLDRSTEAHLHFRSALDLYIGLGDELGQAHTHVDLAELFERQGDHRKALTQATRALDIYQTAKIHTGEAQCLNMVGWCHAQLGDFRRALPYCERALALNKEVGDRWSEAGTWDSLGYIHHHLGSHELALGCYQHSLNLIREFGDRYREAETLSHFGDAYEAAGNPDAASAYWKQALALFDQLNHPGADKVRAKLV
ncbi:MAG TPA: tetratricopeptide repeat protein [Pilimelia sp.]|nr:tetratricopeptide repeat protein [Pilimelia sp.]